MGAREGWRARGCKIASLCPSEIVNCPITRRPGGGWLVVTDIECEIIGNSGWRLEGFIVSSN